MFTGLTFWFFGVKPKEQKKKSNNQSLFKSQLHRFIGDQKPFEMKALRQHIE
jgi:hypothetical protein